MKDYVPRFLRSPSAQRRTPHLVPWPKVPVGQKPVRKIGLWLKECDGYHPSIKKVGPQLRLVKLSRLACRLIEQERLLLHEYLARELQPYVEIVILGRSI